ncbi:MAG: hypothetical protein ACI4BB_02690 [Coprococcus sp.]
MKVLKKILMMGMILAFTLQCFVIPVQADQAQEQILNIDRKNRYEGMKQSYEEGYTPEIEGDTVCLILPVLCRTKLRDDMLKAVLDLSRETQGSFVPEKYEKEVGLQSERVNDSEEEVNCYFITFDIKLQNQREKGSYPLTIELQAVDENGDAVRENITVNVVIDETLPSTDEPSDEPGGGSPSGSEPSTDEPNGSDPSGSGPSTGELPAGDPADTSSEGTHGDKEDGGETAAVVDNYYGGGSSSGETPTFSPKMIVQSCEVSKDGIPAKDEILAGDEIILKITLLNTSSSEKIRNMTVTVSEDSQYLDLLSETDTVYVDAVSAGDTCVVTYKYKIQASAPQGQYEMMVTMDYADSKGNSQNAGGKVRLTVSQPVELQFDPLVLDSEVEVADVVTAGIQAMNLGRIKVHNVRAVIEADGLIPEGTLFIGDIEPGTTASGSVNISVTSLSQGTALYGETKGTVTMLYEDEDGNSYEESMEFVTNIKSPFSDTSVEPEDNTNQWWVMMTIIGGVLVVFLAAFGTRRIRLQRQRKN